MSRRARTRRDKRAPIPDFDDPQPRMPGLFHFWSHDRNRLARSRRGLPAAPHRLPPMPRGRHKPKHPAALPRGGAALGQLSTGG